MNIVNKYARSNYYLYDEIEAGIALMGAEVKAIRKGAIDISNAHAKIIKDEIFLVNATIPVPEKKNYNATRVRKLLLHRSEITSIQTKIKAKKLTIVPTKVYTKGHLVKVQLTLAKGKKTHQKKDSLKNRDIDRDTERALRGDKGNDERK